jgi:hypothetical protein
MVFRIRDKDTPELCLPHAIVHILWKCSLILSVLLFFNKTLIQ